MKSLRHYSERSLEKFASEMRSQLLLWIVPATALFLAALCLSGCANGRRVVIIDPSKKDEVLRTGPNIKGRVYFWNGDSWELSRGRVEIPEGLYIHKLTDE